MNYKILSFVVFSIFLLSMVSAVVVDGYFISNGAHSATINNGDAISLNVDFSSANPPVTIKVALYDSQNNFIYSFADKTINKNGESSIYSIGQSIYQNPGTFTIEIIGSDSKSTFPDYLTLTVNPVVTPINHAPVAQNQNVITNQNTPITIILSSTDADSDTLTYSIITNPSHGILSNFNSNQVTYMPNSGFSGYDSFTFRANDGLVNSNIATVSITVNSIVPINHAPTINPIPNQQVTEGNSYHYHVHATDSDGPDQLTYDLLEAPDWLDINEDTGEIEGTAPFVSSSTNYDIQVRAFDGADYSITQHYILRVKNIASSAGGGGSRVISDSDIYYKNKYFDQYNKDVVLYTKPKTQNLFGLTALTFFYFLIAIISLGIIIVVFLLGRNLRR